MRSTLAVIIFRLLAASPKQKPPPRGRRSLRGCISQTQTAQSQDKKREVIEHSVHRSQTKGDINHCPGSAPETQYRPLGKLNVTGSHIKHSAQRPGWWGQRSQSTRVLTSQSPAKVKPVLSQKHNINLSVRTSGRPLEVCTHRCLQGEKHNRISEESIWDTWPIIL